MTERLYYTDAFATRCEGRVVAVADAGRRIYLDRSPFYPTSGGQPNDTGTIGEVRVVDVIDEDGRVAHLLDAPLPAAEGDTVVATVDWARRFDHMQQHTGQHLLSALFADTWGWPTLSVHFGPDYATLDLDVESIPPQLLRDAERRANALIAENREVTVSFEDAATTAGLRKPSDRDGTLRIVTIEGLDRSACGGTHVRRTGEIGAIVLRRQGKMRKATRLEFVCGVRAIRRVRADYEALASMAQGQSCAIDELPAIVASQAEQVRTLEAERRRLDGELARLRAGSRWAELAPDGDGVRWCVERLPGGKVEDARSFALAFAALPRSVFVCVVDAPPALLLASSPDSGVEAGARLKAALASTGGRGGGSPRLAQGTVPTREALDAALAAIARPN